MRDLWKGSDYRVCPRCKIVISKEEFDFGKHFCSDYTQPFKFLDLWD
jgi:hypothetical protein